MERELQPASLQTQSDSGPARRPRTNILGVGIHAIGMSRALEAIEEAIASRRKGYICVANVHVVIEAQDCAAYKHLLNASFLTVPDGRPLVWVGRLQGARAIEQVGGPEMMLELCELSCEKGYTHLFYGGAPGVADKLKDSLTARFPGLRVVGTFCPPFRPLNTQEECEVRDLFDCLKPDITWVGLGAPNQEQFMARYLESLNTSVMIGVGAAFDMHTGRIKDAPRWAKRCGVAWFFRLVQDPRRLAWRYLRTNPRFLWEILLQFSGLKEHSLPGTLGALSNERQK
jgi:N-acetylglucosaminyldiphosphoundecaprenol N-acetyl-beta-D-mannosaminyltransferase